MSFYRRHLPHWQPHGKSLFITWRLHPQCEKEHWLALPAIAQMVMDAIHFGAAELGRYHLHAFVVMSTHVHLLIDPHVDAILILKNLKGITARRANATLGRTARHSGRRSHSITGSETRRSFVRRLDTSNGTRCGLGWFQVHINTSGPAPQIEVERAPE